MYGSKIFFGVIFFVCILFSIFLSASVVYCLGDPTYDASGNWQFTGSNYNSTCSEPSGVPQNGSAIFTQTGSTFTVNFEGYTMSGTIDGTKYYGHTSLNQTGATVEIDIAFILASNTAGSGDVQWTWSKDTYACGGTFDIALARTSLPQYSLPIFYINAIGKNGTEIGQALAQMIAATFPNIEQQLDSYLSLVVTFVLSDDFKTQIVPKIEAIKSNIDQKYRDEVEALYSSLESSQEDKLGDGKISLNELWFAQLYPDIARTTNCSGFGVFGDASAIGPPIVGRNFDWAPVVYVKDCQAIMVYEYEDRFIANIGFAGCAATFTGFNGDGLFAAILDSPLDNPPPDFNGKRSYVFDLRKALEEGTEISDVYDFMYNKPYTYSHNILLADTMDVQVLEHPQGENGVLRTATSPLRDDISWDKSSQICVVNFFALEGYSNGMDLYNMDRWNRFKELAIFGINNKASVNDVKSIMLDSANEENAIFNNGTLQSMVFSPSEMILHLYVMPSTGAHDDQPEMEEIPFGDVKMFISKDSNITSTNTEDSTEEGSDGGGCFIVTATYGLTY